MDYVNVTRSRGAIFYIVEVVIIVILNFRILHQRWEGADLRVSNLINQVVAIDSGLECSYIQIECDDLCDLHNHDTINNIGRSILSYRLLL